MQAKNDEGVEKRRRACEPCRRRKTKCSGQSPCPPCAHHGLPCTFSDQQRKYPSRTAVDRGRHIRLLKPERANRGARQIAPAETSPPAPSSHSADLIMEAFSKIEDALWAYADSLFPSHPIITPEELSRHIEARGHHHVSAAITYASAAAILDSTEKHPLGTDRGHTHLISRLTKRAIQCFSQSSAFESVSIVRIMTCVFIAKCLTAIDDSSTAFLYLRHAISMVETYRLETTETSDNDERSRKHRLYWLLFVHERYQCISEYRTTVLRPLSELPAYDPAISTGAHKGFIRVVKLFRLLDDDFIAIWLDRRDAVAVDVNWVREKSERFYEDEREAEGDENHLTLAQRADLVITRLWLMTLLWRIAISQRLLFDGGDGHLPLLSPVDISRRLRKSIEKLPQTAIETHGVGIVQKLFELTDTMAEVVLHFPHLGSGNIGEQLEDLNYLNQIVRASDRLDDVRRRILSDKFQRLQAIVR